MKKTIVLLVLFMLLFSILSINTVHAQSLGTMISGADSFISKAETEEINAEGLKNMSNSIYNVLLVLAIAISLIVGAVIGLKLITDGAQGKAQMKQALVPYIVGNAVVFGAFGIWKLVVTLLNSL